MGNIMWLLTILFVGLKLMHIIGWSWWLVLAPAAIPLMLIPIFLILIMWVYNE